MDAQRALFVAAATYALALTSPSPFSPKFWARRGVASGQVTCDIEGVLARRIPLSRTR